MSGPKALGAGAPADYGRTRDTAAGTGAPVSGVRPESPADDAGIEVGMRILSVNGSKLTDMIEWLWESGEEAIDLEVLDASGASVESCRLERLPGEDWGLEFDGAVFDGMRTCVNACVFCFMTMLPRDMRETLYIRDDDYRLSFLQGNFVTLTNMDERDVARAIERHLSPMSVSLHAVSPDVRRRLMGRRAARGIEVAARLMDAGIEIHAQIVVCPGINDGAELDRTLAWCEGHPQVTSVGIVPLGYTRFQRRFTASYSDDPKAARRVIEQVRPYQLRSRARTGRGVFQLADEFYLNAGAEVPGAASYDGYPQYHDGIGMIRAYLDEADEVGVKRAERLAGIARALRCAGVRLAVVSGRAARNTVRRFVGAAPLCGEVWAIRNDYFGGNVDVSGLICGVDLLEQLAADLSGVMLFVPSVMFNSDGLTLDGYHRRQLVAELTRRGARVHVSSSMPADLIDELERALGIGGDARIHRRE